MDEMDTWTQNFSRSFMLGNSFCGTIFWCAVPTGFGAS
jgi:hypothetical protein